MTSCLLDLKGLVKRYGGLMATNNLNLQVFAGETHAIIGPNGAGKTTIIHQIAGSIQPNEGAIIFDGRNVTSEPTHKRVALGLARSYQITNIFRSYTVLDNLALAVQARSGSSLRFWKAVIHESAIFDEAEKLAQRIGLSQRLNHVAGSLAHGEQRQLEVGLALATRPKLLLLDEPMAGMGPQESAALVPLIHSLVEECSVLLVEHDMDAVFQLADRITVVVAGKAIVTGKPDDIRQHPEVKKAYLGDEVTA